LVKKYLFKEICYLEGARVLYDLHVEDAVNLPGLLDVGPVGAYGEPKTDMLCKIIYMCKWKIIF
jgi:hypothetical protein